MKNNLKIKKAVVTAVIIGTFLLNTGTIHGQSSNQITEETNLIVSESTENPIKDLRVAMRNKIPYIQVEIDQYMQNQRNRYILDINGNYAAESYNGRVVDSILHIGTDTNIMEKVFRNLKVGDILTVRLSSGYTGQVMDTLETYATLTVTEDMFTPIPILTDVVHDVRLVNEEIHINLDRESQEDDNRIMFELNGKYIGESWRGRTLYSAWLINRTTDTVTIRIEDQIHIGDTFEIKLSTGYPGIMIDVLDFMTFIVTTEGIVEVN